MKKNKRKSKLFMGACASCGQIDDTHAKGCYYCPEGREQLLGIPPEEIVQNISLFSKNRDTFTVHKSAKKGQTSFRITKDLLENLISTSLKIQKQPKLIIIIQDGSNEYIITSSITKQSR